MASVTTNLKLRLSDDLTADALFNLNKLDSLASVFLTDSTGTSVIRSQGDITIEPNSADIGGSGSGGDVDFGSASHNLDTVNFYADVVDLQSATLQNFTLGALDDLILNANSPYTTTILAAQSGQAANLTFTLPSADGTNGQLLQTDGSGNLSFVSGLGNTLAAGSIDIGSPSNIRTAFDTATGDISADTTNGLLIKAGIIDDANINASAAIALTKLAAVTANRAIASDGSGFFTASSATDTELGYLSGVTGAIQTQIDSKLDDVLTTRGDIITAGVGGAEQRLALGTTAQVIRSDGTDAVWATLSTDDLSEGSALFFTDERAQDAIGSILLDTASIDFTYDDGTPNISAVVLPAGVDHDALNNFVANEHVDHSAVDITTAANSGLAGGGNLTATRSISLDVDNLTVETASDDADTIAIYDDTASANRKMTRANFLPGSFTDDWDPGDGATKAVTHNLGTANVIVQLFDTVSLDTIEVDSVVRTDVNTVTCTASVAPTNTIRVLILEVE